MRNFITLVVAISAVPALAQTQAQIEKRYSRDYTQCIDASDGMTSEIQDCNGAEIDRQDARLNQAWVMVMRPLGPAKKTALRTAQRTWIKQRDAKCSRAAAAEGGGSMGDLIYSGCYLDETIKRTIFLENYKG